MDRARVTEMDRLEILWNPWRYEYVSKARLYEKCILCELPKKGDDESYIIHRGRRCYVLLNAYPYNTGHLMVSPYNHVGCLTNLDNDELNEMMELVRRTIVVLKNALNPDGFNVGLNIGRAAGAGVPDHVHIHVVPRWVGDTNFMAIIGGVKTLPTALKETYSLLKDYWCKIKYE